MTLSKTGLTLALSILTVCLLTGSAQAKQRYWSDVQSPFQNMQVYLDDPAVIKVDLPEGFIKSADKVTLVITVVSLVRDIQIKKLAFTGFTPKLIVNKKLYQIPVKPYPGIQTVEIKIKTKHLLPGFNMLKIDCTLKPYVEIVTPGIPLMAIREMYFKETP